MDTVNKEWNIKVVFITFYKFSVTGDDRVASLFKRSIGTLGGVGPKKQQLFEKLGIRSVGDLLRYYPRAYEDWSEPKKIAEVPDNTAACVKVRVENAHKPFVARTGTILLKAEVTDGDDMMTVTFFNQRYLFDKIKDGGEFLFYGTVKNNGIGYEMLSPTVSETAAACIHPVYPQTAGLTTRQIEAAVRQAAALLPEKTNDPLPEEILKEYDLCSLDFAIRKIHFPDKMEDAEISRKRLAFEEMLVLQLGMARLKGSSKKERASLKINKDHSDEFYKLLPFEPTGAQKRAAAQCINDMMNLSCPMNRLIQGDVGSGKTAVAAAVCYSAVKNGMQCAFMAPTEILAVQHFQSLSALLGSSGVRIELLTGSVTPARKRNVYEALENGEIDIIIGTHALISEKVVFKALGLVITDEQHRFGVAQRAALISKGDSPHIMVMSATPIPRTLALMIFGDLELSVLDEMPPGRQKVDTYFIDSSKRTRAYGFLKKHIENGNQCYIVCPLVEQNLSELKSAEEYISMLEKTPLGEYRLGLLHGKMKPKDKEEVMEEFAAGRIDILVSTTVIEVGVNVPNATIMMIENAERFGLSQLHQLRGRVGRGKDKAYCILVSDNFSAGTVERLGIMCRTNNGFEIADADLKMRGPGDFFGSRQHGLPELKVADMSSMDILEQTQDAAKKILKDDPELALPGHGGLRFETERLFEKTGGEQLQ